MYDIILFSVSSVLLQVNREKPAFSKISALESVLKTCVFAACKRRLRVDGRTETEEKVPFSKIFGCVCTGPKDVAFLVQKSVLVGWSLPGSLLFS